MQPCVCLSQQGECQKQPSIVTLTKNIFIIIILVIWIELLSLKMAPKLSFSLLIFEKSAFGGMIWVLLLGWCFIFGIFFGASFVLLDTFWCFLCYKSASQDSISEGEKGDSHTDIWLLINSELAAKVYIRSPFVVDYVIFTM